MDIRGLSIFIADVRKCQTKEEERARVDKELAKIRAKFNNAGKMKGYDRKKCVCKLLYIYMLGYEIDFGHMEAVHLLSSENYSEKNIGYLACTLLLHENHELVTLITNSIKRDLNRKDSPYDQCLALTAISNLGGKEQAEALAGDVQAILMKSDTKLLVKKKAAITLLRLFRKYPEIVPPESWSDRMLQLLDTKDLGVMISVMSLLLGFVEYNEKPFLNCMPAVIENLGHIVLDREFSQNYLYYGIPAPWLQVKMFRYLQYFDQPQKEEHVQLLVKIIQHTLTHTERIKNVEKGKTFSRNNAIHAVLFEAFNLLIHYDNNEGLLLAAAQKLSRYLGDKDPNLRYVALDTMARMAYTKIKTVKNSIRKHQNIILLALKDADISIRRKALDLLYSMCNKTNASQIVGELLAYLPTSNYELREELVLKIAILAEKFAVDFTWYVDVILNLIATSGDYVTDDIWFRVIQIVTNRDEELKTYAAKTVFNVISAPIVHENAVKVAGYILGEFGDLISDNQGSSGLEQFEILNSKFELSSDETKQMLLNTYIKFYNLYEDPTLRGKIMNVFQKYATEINAELQQRATEYIALVQTGSGMMGGKNIMDTVLDNIPPFQEQESSFLKRIKEKIQNTRALKKERKTDAEGEAEAPKIPEIQDEEEEEEGQNAPSASQNGGFKAGAQKPASSILDMDDIFSESQMRMSEPPAQQSKEMDELDEIFSNAQHQQMQGMPQESGIYPSVFTSSFNPQPAPMPTNPTPLGAPSAPVSGNLLSDPFGAMSFAAEAANLGAKIQQKRETSGVSIQEQIEQKKEEDEFTMSKAVHEDCEQRFPELLMSKGGTVIEDRFLEVSVAMEFHAYQGRVHINYKNKTTSAISQVRMQSQAPQELRCTFTQIPPIILPNTAVTQYLKCDCLAPFDMNSFIVCSLFFQVEKQNIKFQFKLPIGMHKFIEPSTDIIGPDQFFGIWNPIQKNSPQEAQAIIEPPNGTNINFCKDVLSSKFRMAVLTNVDKKPTNIVAAGNFNFDGKTVPVLCRIETNPTAYRVTTRSPIDVVCQNLHAMLKSQIEK